MSIPRSNPEQLSVTGADSSPYMGCMFILWMKFPAAVMRSMIFVFSASYQPLDATGRPGLANILFVTSMQCILHLYKARSCSWLFCPNQYSPELGFGMTPLQGRN